MSGTAPVAPVATRTHTAILASVFILFGIAGGYAQHTGRVQQAAPNQYQALQLYASALIVEWAAVFYVWKGTRRGKVPLMALAGRRWQGPIDFVRDVVIAAALWAIWMSIELLLPSTNTAQSLLPRTPLELAAWMLVALSAGFCEELVFRGYFQRQFHALTGNLAAAIALQALVFGVGHFYEGAGAVAKITLYGGLFGLLAAWRKSLLPGMLAHAWTDIFAVIS
jgi:uncharacterized protein